LAFSLAFFCIFSCDHLILFPCILLLGICNDHTMGAGLGKLAILQDIDTQCTLTKCISGVANDSNQVLSMMMLSRILMFTWRARTLCYIQSITPRHLSTPLKPRAEAFFSSPPSAITQQQQQ
jgi:hypothetical protein